MNDFKIFKSDDRGTTDLGWLKSRHSFSFGRYRDPSRMNYHTLRVLNDDIVMPGAGFGEHPHDNMEIITWVLSGVLTHEDSMGNRRTLEPGEVQMMTAGSGLTHSEMNASETEPVHLLQIWIIPAKRDVEPAYLQKAFAAADRSDQWQLLISPEGADQSLPIAQDASLWVADIGKDTRLPLTLPEGRHGYIHVATGEVEANGQTLCAGDAATFAGPTDLDLLGTDAAQVLWFDLPS